MAEYQHFDGETYITFNIVYATEKEVRLAITNRGRISVRPMTYIQTKTANILNTAVCMKKFISKILR